MKASKLIFSLLLTVLGTFVAITPVTATTDNKTDLVAWDQYSLSVRGERLFIFSGEFQYQRLPVPEMWLDVFQKLRANGFNAVSMYFFWSFHSPTNGTFDFTNGAHDIQRVFDYAKQAGLYVIARPGPYDNAETNAGGFALWAVNGELGKERTSDPSYYENWAPFLQQVGKILAKNQITEGGPVILVQYENELQETTHSANNTLVIYMEQISQVLDQAGIVVPSTSNEKGMRSESWSTDYENVGGAVNVYGLDSYPGGTSCTNPNSGYNLVRTYYQWFQNYSFTQPEFLPEFEGGYFQSWGGSFYDSCQGELSPDFPDLYYKNNIGSRVTMQNLYMVYGGTNWGQSATPVVYTSYDYSAPLRETREIRDKLKQTKLIGLFTRVSSDLLKTEMTGNGTGYTNTSSIFTWALRNQDTRAGFYVVAQDTSSSQESVTFSIDVETSAGNVSIPNINLDGRQSKIIVTDYAFGHSNTLLYSSAEVLTYANLDVDVLALYLNPGQVGTFALKNAPAHLNFKVYGNSKVSTSQSSHGTVYSYTQGEGISVLQFSNGPVVYLLDKYTAWDFFAVPTTTDPIVSPNQHFFVIGPYLVREGTLSASTGVVELVGDNQNSTGIEVFTGSPSIHTIRWNGQSITTKRTSYGSLVGTIPGTENTAISLPDLSSNIWTSQDTIPEIDPEYDDSHWTVCNKTVSTNPVKPLSLPVLYPNDYGYAVGVKVYRGRFDNENSSITGANITVQNGVAAGWSAWLNGDYVGGSPGNTSLEATNAILAFNSTSLKATNNVLTIVTDYTGHDEDNVKPAGTQNPRGILGAVLLTSSSSGTATANFTSWRLRGNAGGFTQNVDPVRGPLNEGGLYAERLGWHLPGYTPPRNSKSVTHNTSPLQGLAKAGANFYITTFDLDLPSNLDVPLGIEFTASSENPAVVFVYINGYQYGHYLPHIGPQNKFPVQPGVINNKGQNTVAIALWALTDQGAKLDDVQLFAYGKYLTGFSTSHGEGWFTQDLTYLQPRWKDRSEYA